MLSVMSTRQKYKMQEHKSFQSQNTVDDKFPSMFKSRVYPILIIGLSNWICVLSMFT